MHQLLNLLEDDQPAVRIVSPVDRMCEAMLCDTGAILSRGLLDRLDPESIEACVKSRGATGANARALPVSIR